MSRREPRLAYLIKWVERGLRSRLDQALSGCGVTTPEYTALSVLRERDGLSSAQLARRVFVTPQAMNLIVIELERRGLIRRRQSETNARTMHVTLTGKGVACLDACDRATLPVEERFLANLSKTDAATLRKSLSICAAALFEGAGEDEQPEDTPRRPKRDHANVQGK
jgi:DNA-binding MarR family transcriptional regulator